MLCNRFWQTSFENQGCPKLILFLYFCLQIDTELEQHKAIIMEGRIRSSVLQQLSVPFKSFASSSITNNGVWNNCQLGKESRRQIK